MYGKNTLGRRPQHHSSILSLLNTLPDHSHLPLHNPFVNYCPHPRDIAIGVTESVAIPPKYGPYPPNSRFEVRGVIARFKGGVGRPTGCGCPGGAFACCCLSFFHPHPYPHIFIDTVTGVFTVCSYLMVCWFIGFPKVPLFKAIDIREKVS